MRIVCGKLRVKLALSAQVSLARFTIAKVKVNDDATNSLRKIRVPVLALFGEDDLNVDDDNTLLRLFSSLQYGARDRLHRPAFPGATHQLTTSRVFNDQVPGLRPDIVINVLVNAVFIGGRLGELADCVAIQVIDLSIEALRRLFD